jgi:hypothetical protein
MGFVSPKRKYDLAKPARLVIEVVVLGGALWQVGHPWLGLAFAAVAAVSGTLNYIWE